MTLQNIFGGLIPNSEDKKQIFALLDVGFKRYVSFGETLKLCHADISASLKLNVIPGRKIFKLYADFYFFLLHGKIIAEVDPTAGTFFNATMDPIVLANGLIKIVSFSGGDSKGPFIHLNTNVRAIIAGQAPTSPQKPEWAGVTSGDPKLNNSFFALTSKIVFLGYRFDVFGLIDQTSLSFYTYERLNVKLPGVDLAVSRQMTVAVSNTMFTTSAGFVFDLEIEIPPGCKLGIPLGKRTITVAALDVSVRLQIRYGSKNWQGDGFLFEASVRTSDLSI